MIRLLAAAGGLPLLLLAAMHPAWAHDPSAWGGTFRTRDFGGSWLSTDAGLYVGGALALSIHPQDPNHLLYATDTRLLRSRNGGRDWRPEAVETLVGPVTAVAFDSQGAAAVASNAAGVFHVRDGAAWQRSQAPSEAAPARHIVAGSAAGEFYLSGATGVYASRDHGARFERLGEGALPDAAATTILNSVHEQGQVFAVLQGRLFRSRDQGRSWQESGAGLPAGRVETLAHSGGPRPALIAAAADALYLSEDQGEHWTQFGARLPESGTTVRGVALSADRRTAVLATHRGVLRSEDGGAQWQQTEGALPVHLEAGLMVRDPHDAATLYTGFALTPYAELYRRAQQGSNLLAQLDPVSIAGGVAFFLLIVLAGIWLARTLFRGAS